MMHFIIVKMSRRLRCRLADFRGVRIKSILLLSFLLKISLFASAFAATLPSVSDFEKHETGWHWYEKRVSQREQPLEKNVFPSQSASEQLSFIKKHIDEIRSEAILSPTNAHVKAYIALQNAITQNAELFSRVWQTVLIENPALRYQGPLKNARIKKIAFYTEKTKKAIQEETGDETQRNTQEKIQSEPPFDANEAVFDDTVLQNAHHTWGLLYFFTSTCPYCQRFSPVVKAVSKRYHLDTLAVSVNGEGLPDFPWPRVDNGEAARLQVTHLPALFLVAPRTRDIQRVSEGEISESELIMRLNTVFKRAEEKNDEKNKRDLSDVMVDRSQTDEVAEMHERIKTNETHEMDESDKPLKWGDFNHENE